MDSGLQFSVVKLYFSNGDGSPTLSNIFDSEEKVQFYLDAQDLGTWDIERDVVFLCSDNGTKKV